MAAIAIPAVVETESLLEGLEALLAPELLGVITIGTGLGFGINAIIKAIKANQQARKVAIEFINSINTGYNSITDFVKNSPIGVDTNKVEIAKIVFPNEIASIEKAINSFNELLSIYSTQAPILANEIDNGKLLYFIGSDILGFGSSTVNISTTEILTTEGVNTQKISTSLFQLGILSNDNVSTSETSILDAFGRIIRTKHIYIDPSKTSVIDVSTQIKQFQQIKDNESALIAAIEYYYNVCLGAIVDTTNNEEVFTNEAQRIRDNLNAIRKLSFEEAINARSYTFKELQFLQWLYDIAGTRTRTITLTINEDEDEEGKRKKKCTIAMKLLGMCRTDTQTKGDQNIDKITASVSHNSEWINKIEFKFLVSSPLNSNNKGQISVYLKSGEMYNIGVYARGRFSAAVNQALGAGYGYWRNLNFEGLKDPSTISYNLPKPTLSRQFSQIEVELENNKNIKYE